MARVVLKTGHFFDTNGPGVREWVVEEQNIDRVTRLYLTPRGHFVNLVEDVWTTVNGGPELLDEEQAARWFVEHELEDEAPDELKDAIDQLRL